MRAKRRRVALVVLAILDEATERGPHFAAVHGSPVGTKRPSSDVRFESAFRVRAEVKCRHHQAGNNFRARFPIKLLE